MHLRHDACLWTLTAALLLACVGCFDQQDLPPPGARGQATVLFWDSEKSLPFIVRTSLIEQVHPGDFGNLHLRPVQIRMESLEGVFYVHAAKGTYQREQANNLILEPERPEDRITISGYWSSDGEPFMGSAPRAIFRQNERLLSLEKVVEFADHGRTDLFYEKPRNSTHTDLPMEWTVVPPLIFWNQDRRITFGPNRAKSTPAIIAALAIMPHPMTLPVPDRGRRSGQ